MMCQCRFIDHNKCTTWWGMLTMREAACVYTCVCACVWLCVCACDCVCARMGVCGCARACMCTCTCVCMHVCVHVCVRVCVLGGGQARGIWEISVPSSQLCCESKTPLKKYLKHAQGEQKGNGITVQNKAQLYIYKLVIM